MIQCKKCNTENNTEARFCESCGTVLKEVNIDKQQKAPLNFCPSCGKNIEQNADFCGECGSSFGEQCPQCNCLNQANAKFCEKCAHPLDWICLLCKNKNVVGATYCENCGSNNIEDVAIYKKPVFLGAVASIILLLSFSFYQYNIFNEQLLLANKYANDDKFEQAYTTLEQAENNWLPFTKTKTTETKNVIAEIENKYKIAIQKAKDEKERLASQQKKKNASKKRNRTNSSNTSSSSSNCLTNTVVYFTGPHTCEIRQSLNVRRAGFDISTSTTGFDDPYASIYAYGNTCVKGNYSFSWSYYSQCVNFGDPDGPYSYSGSFYLDGNHKTYYVNLDYSGYVRVTGY